MSISDKLCMGCMNPLPEGRTECGICGYPVNGANPPLYLPVSTLLSDRYLVGRVLEAGGDGAVYLGFDKVLKAPIFIREFLPDTLCERSKGNALHIISGCENTYRDLFERFRNHARTLARMRDLPAMIPVYDIFEQNNTAYTISEHCAGISLETRLAQSGGRMRWDEARPLLIPLMATISSLHAAGLVHLGIYPNNLLIGNDGKLRLRGFCLPDARMTGTDLKPQLLPGYSAPEQYGFDQTCDATSDVYALAATIFRIITGNPPPDGPSRTKNAGELFVPAEVADELPEHVAVALFNALQVLPENRTKNIEQFRDQLCTAPSVTALLQDEPPAVVVAAEDSDTDDADPKDKKKNKKTKYYVLIVAAVFLVLLLIAGAVILLLFPKLIGAKPSSSSSSSSSLFFTSSDTATTTKYVQQEEKFIVKDVIGKNYNDIKNDKLNGEMKLVVQGLKYSDKEPKGKILEQSPAPESFAAKGTTIQVIISAGPSQITVPDVAGWKEEQARLYLQALGFTVEQSLPIQVSAYERGIVDKTDAKVGDKLEYGSKITMYVSDVEPTTTTEATTTTTTRGWPF